MSGLDHSIQARNAKEEALLENPALRGVEGVFGVEAVRRLFVAVSDGNGRILISR